MPTTRDPGRRGVAPDAPEPLRVPVADDHCHLDLAHRSPGGGPGLPPVSHLPGGDVPEGALSLTDALDRAGSVGIDRVVTVGTDLAGSAWSVLCAEADRRVVAAVALHPNEAPRLAALGELDDALAEIDRLAGSSGRVRAIGETGLDRFRTDHTDVDAAAAQRRSFAAHTEIARRRGLVLQIHDRDAHADVLDVLDSAGAPERVVLHCFSGDAGFARACADRGYVLSFAGTVTFANAGGLRAAVAVTPVDQIQVETDAPFLTPVPHRGRPNASYLVPLTVRRIAEVKGMDVDELCAVLSGTADRLYGPW